MGIEPPSREAGAPRRRRRWVWALGALALVAVVAIGAVAVGLGGSTGSGGGVSGASATRPATKPAPSTPAGSPTPSPSEAGPEEPTAPETPPEEWQPGPVDDPLPIGETSTFDATVTAQVLALEAVEGAAVGPGEVAGPALRISLELDNGTSEQISLDAVLVQLYCGTDAVPGTPLSDPRAKPFSGPLGAGQTATAAYVITCPLDRRDTVQITVSRTPTDRTIAFEGPAPGA